VLWDHLNFEHYAGYWKNGIKNGLGISETFEKVSHNLYESIQTNYGVFRNGVFTGKGIVEDERKNVDQ
jgi:hypothetical protein